MGHAILESLINSRTRSVSSPWGVYGDMSYACRRWLALVRDWQMAFMRRVTPVGVQWDAGRDQRTESAVESPIMSGWRFGGSWTSGVPARP